MLGTVPAMPKMLLHHPVLSVEAGADFVQSFHNAWNGKLEGEPYVVVFEGSVADERIAKRTGGYFSAMGVEAIDGDEHGQPVPTATWLSRLAPGAAATIAIGTCATWGGVPSAEGNPTGAMSVMDFLGGRVPERAWSSCDQCAGLCAGRRQLHRDGLRDPACSFRGSARCRRSTSWDVRRGCSRKPCIRAARGPGITKRVRLPRSYGDPECLVELGCWGPVVNCNIVKRGAINHMGGCMKAGGVCIGCTMPGFPDKFSPFYKTPPGATLSTFASQGVGTVMRRLRRLSNREANREHRWDVLGHVPSGWAHVQHQTVMDKTIKFFYQKWQHLSSKAPGRPPGEEGRFWGGDRPGTRKDYLDDSSVRGGDQ